MNRDDRTPKSPRKPHAISRRSFIKGAGAVAAAAGLVRVRSAEADEKTLPPGVVEKLGPEAATIELNINGKPVMLEIEPRVTLLRALREHLGLTGTKLVCDRGACGACTVHLDGKPVTSCMVLAIDARGHEVTTIEGLGTAVEYASGASGVRRGRRAAMWLLHAGDGDVGRGGARAQSFRDR